MIPTGTNKAMKLQCTVCGNTTFERLPRLGFLQLHVYPFFNRYPWRCVVCNNLVYRPERSAPDAGRD